MIASEVVAGDCVAECDADVGGRGHNRVHNGSWFANLTKESVASIRSNNRCDDDDDHDDDGWW